MKKLNIFGGSKRHSGLPHGTSNDHLASSPSAPTDTLHRIVNAKEEARRKWEADEEEHRRKKRDYEISMIEMEQAEVHRREKEVEKLNALLQDTRRKNQQVQDKMNEQIEILKVKLEEYKMDHKKHESSIEDDISAKTEKKCQVQSSLDQRKKALEIDFQSEAIDGSDQEKFVEDEAYTSSVYPSVSLNNMILEASAQTQPSPPPPYVGERSQFFLSRSPQLSNDSRTDSSDTTSI